MRQVPERVAIRPFAPADLEAIVDIAAAAWAPILRHLEHLQRQALGAVARSPDIQDKRDQVRHFAQEHPDWVLVSELDGEVVAFITYSLDRERFIGTIGNNAVAPEHAGRGIGSRQYRAVLDLFRQEGMLYASVTTGLDESHAAARRAYEKAGFVPVLPHVEYMARL